MLNSHVSTGIIENQANVEALIHALADVQRGILNHRWEEIYTTVESQYRTTAGLTEFAPLNLEQRLEIATIAASARDMISQEIIRQENCLLTDSRLNTALLVEVNETVTLYLSSQEELADAKEAVNRKLNEITGLNTEGITETVSELMELLP